MHRSTHAWNSASLLRDPDGFLVIQAAAPVNTYANNVAIPEKVWSGNWNVRKRMRESASASDDDHQANAKSRKLVTRNRVAFSLNRKDHTVIFDYSMSP
ncbi:hypothetical protein DX884_15205 [Vibrio fluvialis]|nr:hypothetical protein [Vibrio fluvialis]